MFDHVGFGVTDYAASRAFFLKCLQLLGAGIVSEGGHGIGFGRKAKPSLWLFQTTEKPVPLHVAFTAENRKQVQDFHHAALELGGMDNGALGLRPQCHPNYYGAFVIGPDGHNVEAVCHHPGAKLPL